MTPTDKAESDGRDELLRRALATPPISNQEITRRAKQTPRKRPEKGRRSPRTTAAHD